MSQKHPFFSARQTLKLSDNSEVGYYRLDYLEQIGVTNRLKKLPYSIRVVLESLVRHCDGFTVTTEDVKTLSNWNPKAPAQVELPFRPARVLLQDFTGVPCVVDIAAMRAAMAESSEDPKKINPLVPVDLVIDHSVQVDSYGTPQALADNARIEFSRNLERYEFLRWGQNAVSNFRLVPPATGIVHQVNLEYLAQGVMHTKDAYGPVICPDSLVGTDSHTTMINALGVVGWGVGGIEAEAVMLGQPLYMLTPEVIGMKLKGQLSTGCTATDLTLAITQVLRKKGVVDKFVEFFGPGLSCLTLQDRATIANMAPEYGATMGFFPVDQETIAYLRHTSRKEGADLLERYAKAQGLFREADAPEPEFTDVIELDLSTVEPCLAGPKRPHDRVLLKNMKSAFEQALIAPVKEQGFALKEQTLNAESKVDGVTLKHGSVVIAAITSCTNTSNPSVLVGAGLLAKKAVEKGLQVKPYVKTSLAPGSLVVTEYLRESGLLPYLEKLGFYVVGYGCTTCIGNSGPLKDTVVKAIKEGQLVASAVLSGNRNFEGRISPHVRANYLASPPLVVAYALAGTVHVDLQKEPIGYDAQKQPVYLKDIWPSQEEIASVIKKTITPEMYEKVYKDVFSGPHEWQKIKGVQGDLYEWKNESTYIQQPPFFKNFSREVKPFKNIEQARVLALLGDSVTTDHISPAGDIEEKSAAGQYLQSLSVLKTDFNSYGARRGNDRVMVRGTFANIRLKNSMVPGVEGSITVHVPTQKQMSIYDAAMAYQQTQTPLVVIAGKEYGTGSSRDWAAKGTLLLGVKAVLAESFERIHRSNLVGMGVLPLQFKSGENAETHQLTGFESIDVMIPQDLQPLQELTVKITRPDGQHFTIKAIARLDTPVAVVYYKNGGILPTVLRQLMKK